MVSLDAHYEQMRSEVGSRRRDEYPFYTEITRDAVRKFHTALGVHRRAIPAAIPLTFTQTLSAGTHGGGEGLHHVITGERYEAKAALAYGDQISAFVTRRAVRKIESAAYGEAILVEDETELLNHREELLGLRATRFVKFVRGAPAVDRPAKVWSPEELEAVYRQLERQTERLDADADGEMLVLTAGPCTTEDFVAWQAATGAGPFVRGLDERLRVARKSPGLYFRDAHGSPMSYAMVHWDLGAARSIGAARCFDFGRLRAALVERGLLRFPGYRLATLDMRLQDFVYTGELLHIWARISERSPAGLHCEFRCVNQDGLANSRGTALLVPADGPS